LKSRAETGAAVAPAHRGVRLENVKEPVECRGVDADPGIGYGEVQYRVPGLAFGARDRKQDATALGKLDRIADEVDEDWANPRRIADDSARNAVADFEFELQTFVPRACEHEIGNGARDRGRGKRSLLDFEVSGFDFREVQDVVEQKSSDSAESEAI